MGLYDIVLLPTFAQVDAYRKQHAAAGGSMLGCTVTTFGAWVADLWELHGDGRTLASSVLRAVLMRRALESIAREMSPAIDVVALSHEDDAAAALALALADAGEDDATAARETSYLLTPGMADAGARCVRTAAGLAEFEQALAAVGAGRELPGVDAREARLLRAIARYYLLLDELGSVEQGQAAAALADRAAEVFPRRQRVLIENAAPLPLVEQRFLERCAACLDVEVRPAPGGDGVVRAPEGVTVRYAFPSGPTAQPALVEDLLHDLDERTCVVTAPDPLDLYRTMEPGLAVDGVTCAVQGSVAFPLTDFGRAYCAMRSCVRSGRFEPSFVTDVLLSPFSGIDKKQAYDIDAQLRGNRLSRLQRDEVLAELRAASEPFSQLEELARDPQADVLIGAFETAVMRATHRSHEWRAEQLGAMAALREVTSAARAADVVPETYDHVLENTVIAVSFAVNMQEQGAGVAAGDAAAGAASGVAGTAASAASTGAVASANAAALGAAPAPPQVLIATQSIAATLPAASFDCAILTDLSLDSYPASEHADAADTLLGKLGIAPVDTELARARRTFRALEQLPSDTFTLMRPLNDENAAEAYPCTVLAEFVDAYRDDPTATDDIDNPYSLPPDLQIGLRERGEELLYANAHARSANAHQPEAARIPRPRLDDVPPDKRMRVMLPRRSSDGQALLRACPSPSQIEVYLGCPYRWFAERRLGIETLDEDFGPLEKGTFAHRALELFYTAFAAAGHPKVTPENLPEARSLMRDVLDRLTREQFDLEPGSGRLVPTTELELRELQALRDQLVSYLDFESQLLPTFHPAYLEYEIDADHAVQYAGYDLVGKVDRIDVDDQGHAVILDYKGSVSTAHAIGGTTDAAMGKVQTRIYATAVSRQLGLDVVGALYVSYGKRAGIAGAYDPRVIEKPHLPGVGDSSACGTCCEIPPEVLTYGVGARALDGSDPLTYDCFTFPLALDLTERRVGLVIAGMVAGDVEAVPSDPSQCAWCPVQSCPNQGASLL